MKNHTAASSLSIDWSIGYFIVMIHVYLKLIPKVAYLTVSMAHLVCDALICLHLLCNCKQGSSVLALRRGECCDGLFLPAMWFVV